MNESVAFEQPKCILDQKQIMAPVEITIAFIVLVYTTPSHANGVGVTPIAHVLEPLSDYYRDHAVFTSPGFFYGTCDQTDITAHERRCSLALETSATLEKQYEHLRLCNVTLRASAKRGKIGRDFDFYALENTKALMKWSNENNEDRYGIVDFLNCSVIYAKVDDLNIESSYVAGANNETIDVIVKNTRGEQCRSTACKLTLDLEGNVVEHMREWLKTPYKLISLLRSPIKGHVAVDYTGSLNRTLRVYAIDSHGEIDMIKEFPAVDDRLEDVIETSTTYQLLTVCYALESNVTCAQFDFNGTLKFEKTLSPSDRLHSIKVHNIPGGGFIVMTTDCRERVTDKCVPNYISSYNWYLDGEGEFVGYLGTGMFQCSGGGFQMDTEHFFVNEEQELCFSDLCPKIRNDKQLTVLVLCLKRVEFY